MLWPFVFLALACLPLMALFFSKTISVTVGPNRIADTASTEIASGFAIRLSDRVLLLGKELSLRVTAVGFKEKLVVFEPPVKSGAYEIELEPLDGTLEIMVEAPEPWELAVDGQLVETKVMPITIKSQPRELRIELTGRKFKPVTGTIHIKGEGEVQRATLRATDRPGVVVFSLYPEDAEVSINGESVTGATGKIELAPGQYEIQISKIGYVTKRVIVAVESSETRDIGLVSLDPEPVQFSIKSAPEGTAILIGGVFRGTTPAVFSLAPGKQYKIELRKPGYATLRDTISPQAGRLGTYDKPMARQQLSLDVSASHSAELYVDGEPVGRAPSQILVSPGARVEARAQGFSSDVFVVPAYAREKLRHEFEMIPSTDYKYRQANDRLQVGPGIDLLKIEAGVAPERYFGSSSGLTPSGGDVAVKAFYISQKEITAAEFNQVMQRQLPGGESRMPATGVTWEDAARFCNALSEREGLEKFYWFDDSRGVKTVSYAKDANGFRLPTEAEWLLLGVRGAGLAPDATGSAFLWGEVEASSAHRANLAGSEAVGSGGPTLPSHVDAHKGLAPVGGYPANALGLRDLEGNAAEWVHNFAGPRATGGGTFDGFGPVSGIGHLVKGASFRTSSTDAAMLKAVRLGFRAQDDVGFRIARTL